MMMTMSFEPAVPTEFSAPIVLLLGPRSETASTVRGPEAGGPGPFERLVQLLHENERLVGRLREHAIQLDRARVYLARPDCREALGRASYGRAKLKYSGVLLRLRANRLEALGLVGDPRRPSADSAL